MPQILYCYDDASLKDYAGYHAVSSVGDLAGQRFDYVLVTLDGATARGAEATQLLRELGDLIPDSAAFLIIGGVGVGLRAHYRETAELQDDRLLEGTLGNLAYQVGRAQMPLHPPTDPGRLEKASIAYHHFPNKVGFMLAERPVEAAKRFAEIYDRCGISRCSLMKPTLYDILGNVFFPRTAVCDLAGWPDAAAMAANKPLMALCRDAIKDIRGLPNFGLTGKLVGLLISRLLLARTLTKMERDSLPLDFHAFNRFHHGGKVRDQDIQVMRNCVEVGRAAGKPMRALDALVQRYERHCAAA